MKKIRLVAIFVLGVQVGIALMIIHDHIEDKHRLAEPHRCGFVIQPGEECEMDLEIVPYVSDTTRRL